MARKKNKRKKITGLLALILIILAGYLGYSYFFGGGISFISFSPPEADLAVSSGLNTGFADEFFTKFPYNSLQKNGEYPVTTPRVGRENPFSEIVIVQMEPKSERK